MGFIRIKTRVIKGKRLSYAYLVKNKWNKKLGSPRQKVGKYLGRIYSPKKQKDKTFNSHYRIDDLKRYLGSSGKGKIITDLINWELYRHESKEKGICFFRPNKTIRKGKKEAVLMINHGFMCGYTIRRIFNFEPRTDDERETGKELAKRFTEAGIAIPKEVFIGVFDKVATVSY